jgi:hypothetical protein
MEFTGPESPIVMQQSTSAQNYSAPLNAVGFKDAKFDECITNVLSPNVSLRRKSEALNRIIELCQKSGGLDLNQLYKFASLSDVVKTYVT